MRPRETPSMQRWREATRQAIAMAHGAADLFTDYLVAGGPDAIKSLQTTVQKLQTQLEDQKADGRLERYRKLQKDLEECDKVRSILRAALVSCKWTEDEVDACIQKKLMKANTLYGASREMLLRENRLLRSQLEEHLVTSRTSRPGGTPTSGPIPPLDSKLRQTRMIQGSNMTSVLQLREAAEALDLAERSFKLPTVRHIETQADDGSFKYIQTLEKQIAAIVSQKLQLMQQVAALTEQNRVADMKLEGALDQLSEMRRQKTDMLAHQENLSKDLREHLLAEAKRADAAEMALAEVKLNVAAAKEAEDTAVQSMKRAMAEAQAMQAALQEKAHEVDTLRGLYLELREALERLAGDVTSGQQEAARLLLEATREQFLDQRALLDDVRRTTTDTHRAAQHATEKVTELATQQRVLVTEVVKSGEAAVVTLGAYERQLGITQQLLQKSEADRARLARQALAANALNRLEAQRHEKAMRLLLHEVPQSIAQQMAPGLHALAEGTKQLAEELEQTNNALEGVRILAAQGHAPGALHAPMEQDVVDDATSQLLANSRQLRAQLLNLSPGEVGPTLPRYERNLVANGFLAPVSSGQPPTPGVLMPQQPDMFEAASARSERAPVLELVAAAPFPVPQLIPPYKIAPPAPYGLMSYMPGPQIGGLMHPAGIIEPYAAVQAEHAYMLPAPLSALQQPGRLDLVLKLAPEDSRQSLPQPEKSDFVPPSSGFPTSVLLQATARESATLPPTAPEMDKPPLGGAQQGESPTYIGSVPEEPSTVSPPAQEPGVAPVTVDGSTNATGADRGGDDEETTAEMERVPIWTNVAMVAAGPIPVALEAPTQPQGTSSTMEKAEDVRADISLSSAVTDSKKQVVEGKPIGAPSGLIEDLNLPAHVWVPSPALLEAFKDIPL